MVGVGRPLESDLLMEPGWRIGTGICPIVVLMVPEGCGQCAQEALRRETRALLRWRCFPVEEDAAQLGPGVGKREGPHAEGPVRNEQEPVGTLRCI